MNAMVALGRLRRLAVPVISTRDASVALGLTTSGTSHLMSRLASAGLIRRIRSGIWSLDPRVEPTLVIEHLTAPFPSYVSFQSALYLHGMISQIPAVVYVASLGRARNIKTSVGTFSVHRIAPDFFGGFDVRKDGVKLATPEKALLDVLYLSGQRGRLFAALPELELPRRFRWAETAKWIHRIRTPRLKTRVSHGLAAIRSAQAE